MRTMQEQREMILRGLFELRGKLMRWAGGRWSWRDSTNEFERRRYEKGINQFAEIGLLREIILEAIEVEPVRVERYESRYRGRKVTEVYREFSEDQYAVADRVIRNMAAKGYIELRCSDVERNVWEFKILKTR